MEENKTKLDNNQVEELSDDDLEKVSGGKNFRLHFFDKEEDVIFIFPDRSYVIVKETIFNSPITCQVIRHKPFYDPQYSCYVDLYVVEDPDGLYRNVLRDDIVNQAL